MTKRKGVTLIELVVSLALIGIIAVSTLTIFDTGLSNIFRAGSRTKAVAEANHDVTSSVLSVIEDAEVDIKLPVLGGVTKDYKIVGDVVKGVGIEPTLGQSDLEVEIIEFKPQ